jgi:hypothetical protein
MAGTSGAVDMLVLEPMGHFDDLDEVSGTMGMWTVEVEAEGSSGTV